MGAPKRVLCVMDLSCVGRAGLAAALPALAACGVQACGVPSALFSTHTGGFGSVEKRDEAAFGQAALAHYAREGVGFDAVYIGYLTGEAQFGLARQALGQYPGALRVVDPALGDDGAVYGGIGPDTVDAMRGLCAGAHLITPNYTESALLAGDAPDTAPPRAEALRRRLDALAGAAPGRAVLVTSVPLPGGGCETRGRSAGGEAFVIPSRRVPRRYPGTGDLLCAATLGLMLGREMPLEAAARKATAFVEAAARATFEGGGEGRHGLWFEPLLWMLAG